MVRDGRERLLKVEDMEATCESRQGELNVHFMDFCFQVTLKKNLNLAWFWVENWEQVNSLSQLRIFWTKKW